MFMKEEINYEDFSKLDLRIGTIVEAELVPDTDKLIKCTVDFGEEEARTIVSGLAQHVSPEDIIGRQFPYIANLAPRTIRGVESQGMILAAGLEEGFALLNPDKEVPSGSSIG